MSLTPVFSSPEVLSFLFVTKGSGTQPKLSAPQGIFDTAGDSASLGVLFVHTTVQSTGMPFARPTVAPMSASLKLKEQN